MFSKCIHILHKQPQIDTPGSSPAKIKHSSALKNYNKTKHDLMCLQTCAPSEDSDEPGLFMQYDYITENRPI